MKQVQTCDFRFEIFSYLVLGYFVLCALDANKFKSLRARTSGVKALRTKFKVRLSFAKYKAHLRYSRNELRLEIQSYIAFGIIMPARTMVASCHGKA